MSKEKNLLQKLIASEATVVLAEVKPPNTGDAAAVKAVAEHYSGHVDALGISDNRDQVCMSALAAACLIKAAGVTPILHMATRDKNRIALISEVLGAQALGIDNLLCTSGMHQTLGTYRAAKNVFDIDSVQLLQMISAPQSLGEIIGAEKTITFNHFCLCAAADPYADPLEMQIMRLSNKLKAGAEVIITKPVYDLERFKEWWKTVKAAAIHKKAAVIAGIGFLQDADTALGLSKKRPDPCIPKELLDRIAAKKTKQEQRQEAVTIAVEVIKVLAALDGLRGYEICGDGDDDAVLEIIKKSGLRK